MPDELGQGIRALSWPRAVAVRRAWPDGLVIRVEKESVVAAWGDGGYLTSAGKVVSMAEGGADVPTLSTSLAPPRRAMEVYQMLASRLATEDMRLARLDENALGEWRLTLERGITVELGNEALTSLKHERALCVLGTVEKLWHIIFEGGPVEEKSYSPANYTKSVQE